MPRKRSSAKRDVDMLDTFKKGVENVKKDVVRMEADLKKSDLVLGKIFGYRPSWAIYRNQ